ncbi:MAG: PEP-CTERM sorting domain-containing protein [Desulfobulbaceae bacterium]|nr:PEP-CTERM sorting domain-containing protein [Desulfobulbaceae bacterium]
MKNLLCRVLPVFIVFNCSTAEASVGDLINIQFGLSDTTPSYTGQAMYGDAGQTWNLYDADIDMPPVSVTYANGSASSAAVTVSFNTIGVINKKYDRFAGTADDPLMRYYALTYETSSVDFINLDPNATYTLYVYSQQAINAVNPETLVSAGGRTVTLSNPSSADPLFISGYNYTSIAELRSDASGNLSFTYSPGSSSQIGALNGIQLLQTSASDDVGIDGDGRPTPVPEPSTTVLMSIGALFFARNELFRKKEDESITL